MQVFNFTSKDRTDPSLKSINNQCIHCGDTNQIFVEAQEHFMWANRTKHCKDIWPHVSLELIELAISGTHPSCWLDMWPDDDQ